MGSSPTLSGQDDWILAKFYFCVFMDRDEVEITRAISSPLHNIIIMKFLFCFVKCRDNNFFPNT